MNVGTREFTNFIIERWRILCRKRDGMPKPWTVDPILQRYKFCNVLREDDTVTKWIAEHWRNPHAQDEFLWFAMTVARLVNWPDSLDGVGYPVPWVPEYFRNAMDARMQARQKTFSSAYLVNQRIIGGAGMAKHDYLVQYVLNPLWKQRAWMTPYITQGCSLKIAYNALRGFAGIGSFMAAQIVADLKYVEPLRQAKDWWRFAAPGPGSRRGLNRVLGMPVGKAWKDEVWLDELLKLSTQIGATLERAGLPPMHAQDLQNCLCEFDKYMRVKLNEGRLRVTYDGRR